MIVLTLGATLVGAEFIGQALKRLTALQGQTALTYYGAILLIGGAWVSAHAMRSRLLTFGHPIFIRYPEVKVVAEWARQNTPSDVVFLVPMGSGATSATYRAEAFLCISRTAITGPTPRGTPPSGYDGWNNWGCSKLLD